jgi:N utilization substance protein A
MFIEALDVDDVIAHLLVTEGFTSVEEVAFVATDDLAGIEGFEPSIAAELQERARRFLEEQAALAEAKRKELGVTDEVAAIDGLTPQRLVVLGEKGVKTLDDLGDLAADELIEMMPANLKLEPEAANAIIMAARAHWFADEPAPTAEAAAEAKE